MLKDQGLDVEDFGDVNIPCLEEVPLSDLSVKNPKNVGAASANVKCFPFLFIIIILL